MSFSSEIKEELSKVNNLKDKKLLEAEFLGYILTGNTVNNNQSIEFITENEFNIERFYKILFNLGIDYEPSTKGKVFVATININENIEEYMTLKLDIITKAYLHSEMRRGCKETGVKKIRIHDLRHSHVSLLIDMGFTPLAIADRVGHESIDITYRYAHLFPSKQTEIAEKLNMERE